MAKSGSRTANESPVHAPGGPVSIRLKVLSWSTVERWLEEQPHATAKGLFQRLREETNIPFDPGQLRMLQRRVKEWRTEIARRLIFGADPGTSGSVTQREQEAETVTA